MPLIPPGAVGLKFWAPAVPWASDVPGTFDNVVEDTDVANFTGTVAWPVITGVLGATEGTAYELLLHMDGTDGATTFADSGGGSHTVTAHGAAQVDTAQAVFDSQALLLAAPADYLSLDTGNYAFGTGDFCIDFRTRLTIASMQQMFYDGGASGPKIYYDGLVLKFGCPTGTIIGSLLTADTNYHIAATRAAGSTRLWLNGVQQGSTLTDATNYTTASGYPRIGGPIVPFVYGTLGATEGADTAVFAGDNGVIVSAELAQFLARISAPDTAHRNAYAAFIDGLVADGVWAKVAGVYVVTANKTDSKINLKTSSYPLTESGTVNFVADRGFTSDGTSYMTNGYDPSTAGGLFPSDGNSGTMAAYIRDHQTGFTYSIHGAGNVSFLCPHFAGNIYAAIGGTGPNVSAGGTSAGSTMIVRANSTTIQIFKNGAALGSPDSSATAGGSSGSIGFLATGTGSGVALQQHAAWMFGGGLTSTEAVAYMSRLNTYMTAIGANVY